MKEFRNDCSVRNGKKLFYFVQRAECFELTKGENWGENTAYIQVFRFVN